MSDFDCITTIKIRPEYHRDKIQIAQWRL